MMSSKLILRTEKLAIYDLVAHIEWLTSQFKNLLNEHLNFYLSLEVVLSGFKIIYFADHNSNLYSNCR